MKFHLKTFSKVPSNDLYQDILKVSFSSKSTIKFNNLTAIDSKLINNERAMLISSWIQGNKENKSPDKFIMNFDCLLVRVVMDLMEGYFIQCVITNALQLQL